MLVAFADGRVDNTVTDKGFDNMSLKRSRSAVWNDFGKVKEDSSQVASKLCSIDLAHLCKHPIF